MKGLFIGINYVNTQYELYGCINDVNNMIELYKKKVRLTNYKLLTDYTTIKPTKNNILEAIKWLVSNNKKNEQLIFHYSGHGSQVYDTNGDETDKLDETIVPSDFKQITDDELFINLISKLNTSRLFAVLDSCHSGSGFDLKYTLVCSNNKDTIEQVTNKETNTNAIFLSGCRDNQTSADAFEKINNKYQASGALTWALYDCLFNINTTNKKNKNKISNGSIDLLKQIRQKLINSNYDQIPQLSFSIFPYDLYSDVVIRDSLPINITNTNNKNNKNNNKNNKNKIIKSNYLAYIHTRK